MWDPAYLQQVLTQVGVLPFKREDCLMEFEVEGTLVLHLFDAIASGDGVTWLGSHFRSSAAKTQFLESSFRE